MLKSSGDEGEQVKRSDREEMEYQYQSGERVTLLWSCFLILLVIIFVIVMCFFFVEFVLPKLLGG